MPLDDTPRSDANGNGTTRPSPRPKRRTPRHAPPPAANAAAPTHGAPLRGRHVALRPITPADHGWLYALVTHPENGYRWRYGGATPSPEFFAQSLWDRVLVQLAIQRLATGVPIGLVVAYAPDFHDGHVQMAALLDPAVHGRGWPIEAVVLLVNHLFTNWNFRKLYAESIAFNYAQFASGTDRLFAVEARLPDHHYWNGRFWDKVIGSCTRERWAKIRPALLRFALGRNAGDDTTVPGHTPS